MPCCPPLIFRGKTPHVACPTFGFWLLPDNACFDAGLAQLNRLLVASVGSVVPPAGAVATIANGGNTLDIKIDLVSETKGKFHVVIFQHAADSTEFFQVVDLVVPANRRTHLGFQVMISVGDEYAVFVRPAKCGHHTVCATVALGANFVC
jgi:hypothetical protein